MAYSIYDVYRQIFRIWRARRFELFLRELKPSLTQTLLDVGGYPGTWTDHPMAVGQIDCLNVHKVGWNAQSAPSHRIRMLLGDGCRLTMPDKSYDIVFSNSVIEHVGDWNSQVAFAAEVRRVGNGLWVQTPAREFPIEPHYLAPFIHYLPQSVQKRVVRWFTLFGLIQKPSQEVIDGMVDSIRLLTYDEM